MVTTVRARCSWLARAVLLGLCAGILAGLSSAGFLASLDVMTDTRRSHRALLWFLPVAGLVIGVAYHYGGGRSAGGNALIVDEIHTPGAGVPRRMAPLVYVGTLVTHLFGGSAGREGTAVQMSGSLSAALGRRLDLTAQERRLLLIAAISAGFASVFGVPFAGAIFGLEVRAGGRLRWAAAIPAVVASLVGAMIVYGLGIRHATYAPIGPLTLSPRVLGSVAIVGACCGLTSIAFVELTHGIQHVLAVVVGWPPLRPVIGGVAVIGLTLALGTRAYLGLSTPLLDASLAGGAGVVAAAFALKLVFTAITLGSGFPGGEVTPLFVMGATLGVTVAHVLHAPVSVLAAVGFVALFAGAANTPLTCFVMGVEIFGAALWAPLAIGCVLSFACSSHRSIYASAAHGSGRRRRPLPRRLSKLRSWRRARSASDRGDRV